MRRLIIWCSAAALLLVGGALASSTAVQATTPPTEASAEDHSIVGAWLLTVDEFPEDPPELLAFHADGTFQQASADGTTGIGSWEATGPDSVNLTFFTIFFADDEGSAGMETIRATGEVSEDGQTFTAEFSIEFTGEGVPPGEYGPGHVTGRRINVEPMGAPVGTLDDLFAAFDEGNDAVEGTAVAESTGPGSTGPGDTRPDANVERYCALVQELDEAGGDAFAELEADESATDEDFAEAERQFIEDHQAEFDELREVAPEEIASDIDVLLAAQEQRAAGGEQEDVTEQVVAAEERIGAFEEQHCTTE